MLRHAGFLLVFSLLVMLMPGRTGAQQTLIVFAASSLTDAFEEIGVAFEQENPGVEVLFNFAGSSTLSAQLAEGAPADVFASANTAQMQLAREAGRIEGRPLIFARNRLVAIVPADNPAGVNSLSDLALPGLRLLVAAPGVPVRTYTDTMLDLLAQDADFGESYREAVLANIVSEEENVRQVAAKVALGEADAGVVYISDVRPDVADQITAIAIPDHLNTLATYPIAVTTESSDPELAAAFVDFVLSEPGQSILTRWNFIPAPCLEVSRRMPFQVLSVCSRAT